MPTDFNPCTPPRRSSQLHSHAEEEPGSSGQSSGKPEDDTEVDELALKVAELVSPKKADKKKTTKGMGGGKWDSL